MHSVSVAASCRSTRYFSAEFNVSIHFVEGKATLMLIRCHSSVPRELDLQEDTNSMLSSSTAGFFDSLVSASFVSTMCLR